MWKRVGIVNGEMKLQEMFERLFTSWIPAIASIFGAAFFLRTVRLLAKPASCRRAKSDRGRNELAVRKLFPSSSKRSLSVVFATRDL